MMMNNIDLNLSLGHDFTGGLVVAYKNFSHLKKEYKDVINYCRNLKVGDKIKFQSEKQRYTIKAKSDRYLICTKPFNPKKTCLYTIIDLERLVRGTNNMVFNPYDYNVQEDIDQCLIDLELEDNVTEVTHRNCIQLDVEMLIPNAHFELKEVKNWLYHY